ncbi:hypothetical protein ACTD5D_21140 [Nocardia takedensis]|uniref:hypothetical protein n=1 Tax=Nocardia takedensis TaxID=259390 RepID=UPI003F769C5C
MREAVTDTLSDLGIPLAGTATRSIRSVVEIARRRRLRQHSVSRIEGYEEFLHRCTDEPTPDDTRPEIACDMAALLDFEISNRPSDNSLLVVAFLDTFERLTDDSRRHAERYANHLIWATPNILWVVTGRNMLDWHEGSRSTLFRAGPDAWPGLDNLQHPCQHLIGKLSIEDSINLLNDGLEKRSIAVPDQIIEEIAIASGGLPQYLAIALEVARNADANGQTITVNSVSGSLGDLVHRVLEDVPPDERNALRVATLLPFVDVNIVAATAQVSHGCALRALSRPMVDQRGPARFPYTIHDEIRHAIRRFPASMAGGWSESDWTSHGSRALSEIRQCFDLAAERQDTSECLDMLGLAISLVCAEEVEIEPPNTDQPTQYRDWLSKAIVFGPSIAGLHERIPSHSSTSYGKSVIDFILARSEVVPVDERGELLTGIFESSHPLKLAAGRHRGYTLRTLSRWPEAFAAFDDLALASPLPMHKYQVVYTYVSARRFREAADRSHMLTAANRKNIRVTIEESHGEFSRYFEHNSQKIERLKAGGRQRELLEQTGNAIRWKALLLDTVTHIELSKFQSQADVAMHSPAIRDGLLAHVFRFPNEFLPDGEVVQRLVSIDHSRNLGEIGFRSAFARASLLFFHGDLPSLGSLAEECRNRQQTRDRTWIPVECLLDLCGIELDPVPTQWIGNEVDAVSRWKEIFLSWRIRRRQT